MAIIASFSSGAGLLSVFGDSLGNSIRVSRDATETLLVNGGGVSIKGGKPTVANTTKIQVFGLDGNDTITLDESNGALPPPTCSAVRATTPFSAKAVTTCSSVATATTS